MKIDWRHLRQQGFLTLAILLSSATVIATLLPSLSWRQAMLLIALVALLIGWVP
jgi:hypothetical protein